VVFGFVLLIIGTCLLTTFDHGYYGPDYGALAVGIILTVIGSFLVLFSCPPTTRRLVKSGRPPSLTGTTNQLEQVSAKIHSLASIFIANLLKLLGNAGAEQAEAVREVNVKSKSLHEQLQVQMSQIQELTERLNRVEEGQQGQQREANAHEIIELEQETKDLGRE